jgi:uncharacterized protein YjiS (DUF1127 family)
LERPAAFLGAAIPDERRKPMFHYLKRVSIGLRARRAERALHELPDHILKDIGIRRGAISYVVREHLNDDRI